MASGGMYAQLFTMSYATVGGKDRLLEDEPESSAQHTSIARPVTLLANSPHIVAERTIPSPSTGEG